MSPVISHYHAYFRCSTQITAIICAFHSVQLGKVDIRGDYLEIRDMRKHSSDITDNYLTSPSDDSPCLLWWLTALGRPCKCLRWAPSHKPLNVSRQVSFIPVVSCSSRTSLPYTGGVPPTVEQQRVH